MARCSRPNEYALGTLKGLMFVRIMKDEKGKFVFEELKEVYLRGYYVRNVIEYQNDEFLTCLNEDNLIYHIDRKTQEEADVSENPSSKSRILCMKLIPRFSMDKRPYVIMRDQDQMGLLDVKNFNSYVLHKARY